MTSADLSTLLAVLRLHGVTEYLSDGNNGATLRIKFSDLPVAAPAVKPSTPELSGTTTPTRDIFDVLSDGVIPGAPRSDGFPPDQ